MTVEPPAPPRPSDFEPRSGPLAPANAGFHETYERLVAAALQRLGQERPVIVLLGDDLTLLVEGRRATERVIPDRYHELKSIDHLNITVSDLQASIDFYGGLFGFDIAEDCRQDERPYVIMGRAGVGWLALHSEAGERPSGDGRINHWGFVVDDFDGLPDRLASAGIQPLYVDRWPGGVVEYPRSRSLYVGDPDGNEIELTSRFGGGLA